MQPTSIKDRLTEVESFEHKLQRFDPGIVWLDSSNRVTGLNGVACEVLGAKLGEVIGTEIAQLHPEKSRSKVNWLVASSSSCPVDSPPPMTMMINIPDRVLLIKVSKMIGANGLMGTCMVFFDLTDVTTTPRTDPQERGKPRLLFKLPVYRKQKVILVDLNEVVYLKADGHYTTVYTENENYLCNLSLSDLESRLDPVQFVRVHRSYMINIRFASAFEKVDEQCTIVMQTEPEERLPISRSNIQRVKVLLGLV